MILNKFKISNFHRIALKKLANNIKIKDFNENENAEEFDSGLNNDVINKNSINNNELNTISSNLTIPKISEPLEYRTMFIDSLPTIWNINDITYRINKIGESKNIHLIKNSIGEFKGEAIITYEKIKSVETSIEKMKWKIPDTDPIRVRFHRFIKYQQNLFFDKKVLLIKNLPQELKKEELELYINSINDVKCIHISYARTHDDKFKRQAYVYFFSENQAEIARKKLHKRHVMSHELNVKYPESYYDPSDFRYHIENKLKLDIEKNLYLNLVHREFLRLHVLTLDEKPLKHYNRYLVNEKEKLDFYDLKVLRDQKLFSLHNISTDVKENLKELLHNSQEKRKEVLERYHKQLSMPSSKKLLINKEKLLIEIEENKNVII